MIPNFFWVVYIRTLFYFKIEKNNKERKGNKKDNNLILRKMYNAVYELTNLKLVLEAGALTIALWKVLI